MDNRDYDACQRLVAVLNKTTSLGWTFGYLGNCSGMEGTPAFQDDRFWYAFASHPGRVGTARDRIGGFSTSELDRLAAMLGGAVSLALVQSARVSA